MKKRLVVEYGGGKRLVVPQPEKVDIKLVQPGLKPVNFSLRIDRPGMKNLSKALKKFRG